LSVRILASMSAFVSGFAGDLDNFIGVILFDVKRGMVAARYLWGFY